MKLRSGSVSRVYQDTATSKSSSKLDYQPSTMTLEDKQVTNNELMAVLMSNKDELSTIRNDIKKINRDHDVLKADVKVLRDDMDTLKAEVNRLKVVETDFNRTKDAYLRSQITAVKSIYNSMQYNVIVHKLDEQLDDGDDNETTANSIERATYVIRDIFRINTSINIDISTAHRLPSTKAGAKPLIFKLAKLSDKQLLWKNIANVKLYNNSVPATKKVSIQMIQLPPKLANDKSSLQADFDKERSDGNTPKWRYLKSSGIYCYEVKGTYYKPKVDHFLHKYVGKKQ